MTVGSGSAGGGQHEFAGRSRLEPSAPASRQTWPRAEYGVVVHSHTLPIMSKSPKAFGAKVPTGDVPTQPRCQHAAQGRTVDVTGHAGGPNQADRPGFPIKWRNVDHAREVMGMPWADGRGCTEAIPPAYTEYIGQQLIAALQPDPLGDRNP